LVFPAFVKSENSCSQSKSSKTTPIQYLAPGTGTDDDGVGIRVRVPFVCAANLGKLHVQYSIKVC
jgi:hypothetical protein